MRQFLFDSMGAIYIRHFFIYYARNMWFWSMKAIVILILFWTFKGPSLRQFFKLRQYVKAGKVRLFVNTFVFHFY